MKLYAVATKAQLEAFVTHREKWTGDYHYIESAPGVYLCVCIPHDYDAAEAWLTAQGVNCFPHLLDTASQIGPALAASLPSSAGVLHSDGTFAAAKKLAQAHGWPMLSPSLRLRV
jgi:hypothetical protein